MSRQYGVFSMRAVQCSLVCRMLSVTIFAVGLVIVGGGVLESKDSPRLPKHLWPTHYRIKLIPFLWEGNFTTAGEEWVELNCVQDSDLVVFNINNLTIHADSVSVSDLTTDQLLQVTNQSYNNETQKYSLVVSPKLKSGSRYMLHLKFTSMLNDLLQGLYRSSYVDVDSGQKRWLATSQFSPTDARRAFPGWDEPLFKARFTISLGHQGHMQSWSNMPVSSTTDIEGMEGWVWDNYLPTVPMSTYLVAFMVSDLKSAGVSVLPSGLKFQVIARKDELAHTKYAALIGPKLLMFLEDYFKLKFPLPKLDMVAVPDFGFMAMENWGFITFRESALLYDPEEDSLYNHDETAETIGHEIAHQWFGNLVTPAWWEDLWLKEGFATFISYLAVDKVQPEGRFRERFVVDISQPVMVMDSLLSSHQISVPLDDPKDITQIFDTISYKKGASIIRMMQHFIGPRHFKAGLTAYLEKFAYNNTCQDQLWQVLNQHRDETAVLPTEVTVKDIMDSWTLQVGYPVVTVNRDYKTGSASVTQDRFLLSSSPGCNSSWWIPLSYTTKLEGEAGFLNTKPKLWLNRRDKSGAIDGLNSADWLVANINQTGFYRVNYDERNWALLTTDFESLPELTRAQLLNDALSLARAGLTPYSIALNLTKQLYHDNSYFTWKAVHPESRYIHDMLVGTPAYDHYKKYVLKMLRVEEMNLTLDSLSLMENLLERLHKIEIIELGYILGFAPLVEEVRNLTERWIAGEQPRVMPDLRMTVYCTAVAYGDDRVWQFFWSLYKNSKAAIDRENLLRALSCSRNPDTLRRYLNMILDEKSDIRKQNGAIVFTAIARNKKGYQLAFDYLANNWHAIQEYFGLGFRRISNMVLSLTKFLKTPEQLEQLKALQANHSTDLGSTAQAFKHTIEMVTNNVAWSQAYRSQIDQWLTEAIHTL